MSTCRHLRQRILVLRDFNREQRCSDCNVLIFRLAPVNPTDDEIRALHLQRRPGGETPGSSSPAALSSQQGPLVSVVSPPPRAA
jgi:hypothetical protein